MKPNTPALRSKRFSMPAHCVRGNAALRERGVILIITLIMLVVTSSMAALAIKGTSSTEAIANNSRTQGLAMQAAEAALRYCEVGVRNSFELAAGRPSMPAPNLQTMTIALAPIGGATATWATIAGWEGNTIASTVIPLANLDNQGSLVPEAAVAGNPGSFASVYQRAPDCIAQLAPGVPAAPGATQIINVVARGFGPDVANNLGNPGAVPFGAEVFLHATLSLP
jgi:hypothetical protein